MKGYYKQRGMDNRQYKVIMWNFKKGHSNFYKKYAPLLFKKQNRTKILI